MSILNPMVSVLTWYSHVGICEGLNLRLEVRETSHIWAHFTTNAMLDQSRGEGHALSRP